MVSHGAICYDSAARGAAASATPTVSGGWSNRTAAEEHEQLSHQPATLATRHPTSPVRVDGGSDRYCAAATLAVGRGMKYPKMNCVSFINVSSGAVTNGEHALLRKKSGRSGVLDCCLIRVSHVRARLNTLNHNCEGAYAG